MIQPGNIASTRVGFGTSRLHHLGSSSARQRLLARANDLGISHFDTAPVYGHGLAERELALFLKGRRTKCVVVTKYGLPATPWIDGAGPLTLPLIAAHTLGVRVGAFRSQRSLLTADGLRQSIEKSLRRLRTDFIDVHLLHDPALTRMRSVDDLLEEYTRLRKRGLIRAFGLAGSYKPCLEVLRTANIPMVLQTAEHEWDASQAPAITFGALNAGPQRFGSVTTVIGADAGKALRASLARRPTGVVLVSTRRGEHLDALAHASADEASNASTR